MWDCPCCGTEGPAYGPPWARRWGPPPWAAWGPGWAQAPTRRERKAGLEEAKRRLGEQLADINEELGRE